MAPSSYSKEVRLLQAWLRTVHVKPIYIYPGSPWENGYNERFNGTLRHEVLDPEVFYSLDEAPVCDAHNGSEEQAI